MTDISNVVSKKFDLPRYKGKQSIYIIATQPRSGSHYFAYLLRQTGHAGVPLEYFHKEHWRRWRKRCEETNPLVAFRLLCQLRTSNNGLFGIKAHWHQFSYALSMHLEEDLVDARFAYLCRNDLLAQAISHAIALQTGSWHASQKSATKPIFSFDRISDCLKVILTERSSWERFFCMTGIKPHRIIYEDLLNDKDMIMAQVCNFLSIDWTGDSGQAPAIQRDTRNEEWKERYLEISRLKHDEGCFWMSEFGSKN